MALEAVILEPELFSYNAFQFTPSHFIDLLPPLTHPAGITPSAATTTATNTTTTTTTTTTTLSSPTTGAFSRTKRRRSKTRKNKQELENQRMTHIAVERNRRRQMNHHLAVLRSLMPDCYIQRGDQASVVAGAINFVKELENSLHSITGRHDRGEAPPFFAFPQAGTAAAEVEVTVAERHANIKVRARRRPMQLVQLLSGLHILRLSILHLNIATVDDTALYTLSVKVEEDSGVTSTDEIAGAVHRLLRGIQEEDQTQTATLNREKR